MKFRTESTCLRSSDITGFLVVGTGGGFCGTFGFHASWLFALVQFLDPCKDLFSLWSNCSDLDGCDNVSVLASNTGS